MLSWQEAAYGLSMIDANDWPNARSKFALVNVVMVSTIGNAEYAAGYLIPNGDRFLARETGLEPAWVRVVMRELLDERVILVAEEAAGRRSRCYIVNPNVRAWRVPWRAGDELLARRLDLVAGRLVMAKAGFAPRYGAAQTKIAPRDGAAQKNGSAAPWRGTNGHAVPRHGAAQTNGHRAHSPISTDEDLSRERDQSAEQEHEQRIERIVAAVIERKGAGTVVARSLRDRIGTAIVGLDTDQLHQAEAFMRRYGDDRHMPPLMVDHFVLHCRELRDGGGASERASVSVQATAELLAREAEIAAQVREQTGRPDFSAMRAGVAGGCDDGPSSNGHGEVGE